MLVCPENTVPGEALFFRDGGFKCKTKVAERLATRSKFQSKEIGMLREWATGQETAATVTGPVGAVATRPQTQSLPSPSISSKTAPSILTVTSTRRTPIEIRLSGTCRT